MEGQNLNLEMLTEFIRQLTEGDHEFLKAFAVVSLRLDRSLIDRRFYLLVSSEVLAELEKHRKPSDVSGSAPFPGLAAGARGIEIRLHQPTIVHDQPCLYGEPWSCCVSKMLYDEIMKAHLGNLDNTLVA